MSSVPQYVSIEEMATKLGIPHHLILFWQKKFNCFRLTFRPADGQMIAVSDATLVAGIYTLLQNEGCTLRDVQRLLKQRGISHVASFGHTMASGAEKFNGTLPTDIDYTVQNSQMRFNDNDDDLDTDLETQQRLSHRTTSSSGRPSLGSGMSLAATYGLRLPEGTERSSLGSTTVTTTPPAIPPSSSPRPAPAATPVAEDRVSIFDIATGAQPSPSIATGTASVAINDEMIEALVKERTAAMLSERPSPAAVARTESIPSTLNQYSDKMDVIQFPSPHKMRQAIQGLSQTLQKLDTLHQELVDLENALKEGLETMGYSGFRNAYKDYDERRFDIDASVL